ncbi:MULTISPECIES: TraR/DksA family transcriptional regulator [unclassified Shewanella]|uniref:TraR/DksA family transcriptional regulator n=1 Tax=unclassified Shewanella TaxID=196818 RepID=UPI00097112B6|nr:MULTISPECIES: TraR/DksA C4-type zinc finger protein [unclassified Shewanella]MDO6619441.1 TraR/DksA C4-type zinc finger protein [Shewanella sp. 6_MG-2023]MDO6639395.1 TraR/DksA C4-type zinc finger protein [Shewanella sp. 5_MG-2023]MDO6678159.1 TraR/DksA C4-type zinc finger protein [Shewanella sp. 4_MG-2023]PMH84644.1 conjugal transfer protein TraR [Shewanella sp. 10N.286.48.B5]PMI02448.1 conjugal transfer protein TraR [Shewanella sp. 10N.286.48.A6]
MNTQDVQQILLQREAQLKYELVHQLNQQTQPSAQVQFNMSLTELIELMSEQRLTDTPLFGQLTRLDAALCQLELGLYGLCSDCESDIEAERLAADPTEQRCAHCAEKYNQQHRHELKLSH